MELSELVILLHVKSDKKQTYKHFGALKIPVHFLTPLPPNQKQSLPWEKFCYLENGMFSKPYTDGINELFQENPSWSKESKIIYLPLSAFSLSQNNPENYLLNPWL